MRVCKFCTGLDGNHTPSCTRFDYFAPLPPLPNHQPRPEWRTNTGIEGAVMQKLYYLPEPVKGIPTAKDQLPDSTGGTHALRALLPARPSPGRGPEPEQAPAQA